MQADPLEQALSLHRAGRLADAEAIYRAILQRDPDHGDALQLLGAIAHQCGQHGAAIQLLQRSLAVSPHPPKQALNNLGEALRAVGDIEASIATFRRALELNPGYIKAHSNLLLTLHFHSASTGESLRREHEGWVRAHADRFIPTIAPHANDRSPDRVLRIGYVSPDFKQHSVAYFIEPIIRCHRRDQVRVYCYSNTARTDEVTARIRQSADEWRDITRQSDDASAARVRQDQIDILIDLAGHMGQNRLLLFARKPAPIQATWLGYPNGTGMPQMDYRLTDAIADPPGLTDDHYVERFARLPSCAWLYQPPHAPAIAPAPDRPITFGSFNKFPKVSAAAIRTWARILVEVPGSRLVLKAKSLGDETTRAIALRMLQSHGIPAERVSLGGWEAGMGDHLARYNEIDVALDPFPYTGTTTTCEALWMGVPVVTLAGQTHVSRVGASLLTAMGMPECIAAGEDRYISAAVALARSRPSRDEVRHRLSRSPLMDIGSFVNDLENLYRQMWHAWIQA